MEPHCLSGRYYNEPPTYALVVFGEVELAKTWLLKMIKIHEQHDGRSRPNLAMNMLCGSLNSTHSLFKRAGLSHLVVRLMRAMHTTFDEIEATSSTLHASILRGFAWETDKYSQCSQSFWVAQIKRRHFLHAPEDIGDAEMLPLISAGGSPGHGLR